MGKKDKAIKTSLLKQSRKPGLLLRAPLPPYTGERGKPVKIAADFDTALDALVAVPSPKRRRKAGRP